MKFPRARDFTFFFGKSNNAKILQLEHLSKRGIAWDELSKEETHVPKAKPTNCTYQMICGRRRVLLKYWRMGSGYICQL
ncbi:unnamed protein product [Dovyalis caffra]|uniref:Uncharacterized protein n=1 Tax=Dovyalis caffra TaxID=77055 RepID=A0AAV1SND0_9ROSI|nr:unnamed protein product [Dovyalis caffra]